MTSAGDDEPIDLLDFAPELLVRRPLSEIVDALRLCPPAADALAVWLVSRLRIARTLDRSPEFKFEGERLTPRMIRRATVALTTAQRWRFSERQRVLQHLRSKRWYPR